jgi:hypothetical protein
MGPKIISAMPIIILFVPPLPCASPRRLLDELARLYTLRSGYDFRKPHCQAWSKSRGVLGLTVCLRTDHDICGRVLTPLLRQVRGPTRVASRKHWVPVTWLHKNRAQA